MNSVTLLRDSLKNAHTFLEQTMEGVTPEVAHWQPDGTAHSIAATYAHVVASEDATVHWLLKNDSPLSASTYSNRTGMSEPFPQMGGPNWQTEYPEWTKKVKIDLNMIKAYAQAVYDSTDEYLASLTDDDLDRELDMSGMGMGKMSVGMLVSDFILGHTNSIMGEISALKGLQGLKGYPW